MEGPPSLGTLTKLGLPGRDEEIANFITFMKNLKQHGEVDVICYNWMPVISWALTQTDRPARGGALVRRWDKDVINFVHFRSVQDLSGVLPSTKFT